MILVFRKFVLAVIERQLVPLGGTQQSFLGGGSRSGVQPVLTFQKLF